MPFVNQQPQAGQVAKTNSLRRWKPRRVAYLAAAVIFIAIAGYAVKMTWPKANAAPVLPLAMKLVDRNGDLVNCTVSVAMERAEDFDLSHPKFKLTITDSTCTGSGIANAIGSGFIQFPNNGSCVQIQGGWTGTVRWKDSAGAKVGTSEIDGTVTLASTGTGGTKTEIFAGSVTGGDKFVGGAIGATIVGAGTGLNCILVGDIAGGDLSGDGAVAQP